MQKLAFFFRILNSSVKQQGNNDKKVPVKNILQNFYLFKIIFEFASFIYRNFLGYLLYRSYSSIIFKENIETSENNNLINSINLNSSKIETIESLLNENSQN